MNYRDFQNEYKRERIILSLVSTGFWVVIGVLYLYQHPEFLISAANAVEPTFEVFASVIRGVAQ